MTTARKRIIGVGIVAAALVAGATFGAFTLRDWPVHHFRTIEDGKLYAGGQPGPGAIDFLINRKHIKTIVNFRGAKPGSKWYNAEHNECLSHGIRLIDLPLGQAGKAADGIRQFLTIMSDPANQPVFIHCQAGSVRTSFAVAAYRMCRQGWTLDRAMEEAGKFRYTPSGRQAREYRQILEKLSEGADWRIFGVTESRISTSSATQPHYEKQAGPNKIAYIRCQ